MIASEPDRLVIVAGCVIAGLTSMLTEIRVRDLTLLRVA